MADARQPSNWSRATKPTCPHCGDDRQTEQVTTAGASEWLCGTCGKAFQCERRIS